MVGVRDEVTSREICDVLRKEAKQRLTAKFNALLDETLAMIKQEVKHGDTRKRRLCDIVERTPKRAKVKQEADHPIRRKIFSSLNKRNPVEVVEELLKVLEEDDSALAAHLVREFAVEHVSSASQDLSQICEILLKAAAMGQDEDMCRTILRMVCILLERTPDVEWKRVVVKFLLRNTHISNRILDRRGLDGRVLAIIVKTLRRGLIQADKLPARILNIADRSLRDATSTFNRISAIECYLAKILTEKKLNRGVMNEVVGSFCGMLRDPDARCRVAAVDALSKVLQLDHAFSVDIYETIKKMMNDSERHVRIQLLRIIMLFANKMPNREVKSEHGDQRILLQDDAFSIVCHAINDTQVMVRTEAAIMLGKFESVSQDFLDQTLDKKMMRSVNVNNKEQVARNQESRFSLTKQPIQACRTEARWKKQWSAPQKEERRLATEWASGKDLNAPSPDNTSAKKEENESIVNQGACGAFVSALEDEFMSVRKAAVYSLGKLAANRPTFAHVALDHLADMFNDEIAEVRIDAVYALTPLVQHGQLQKDQLETILKCLDDAMLEPRQALRILLSQAEFADVSCMKLCVQALINCLQRFPQDKMDIYQCLSALGRRHGTFVHALVKGLLDLHPIFHPQEQPIDDPFYVARLTVVLNGASAHPPIVSLLPEYVKKHYWYMRTAQPHLVAAIESIDEEYKLATTSTSSGETLHGRAILLSTFDRLREAEKQIVLSERNELRRYVARDCEVICAFNAELAGGCQFLARLGRVVASVDQISNILLCGGDFREVRDFIEQMRADVVRASIEFSGVPTRLLAFLVELRFYLALLDVVALLLEKANESLAAFKIVECALETSRREWSEVGGPSDNGLSLVARVSEMFETSSNKLLLAGSVANILMDHVPRLPEEFPHVEDIKAKWAEIVEPDESALEKEVRFVAGLPTAIALRAKMHNFAPCDLERCRIEIEYPDHTKTLFRPRPKDFIHSDTLDTQVLLWSGRAWSDSATVRLSVVIQAQNVIVPIFSAPASGKTASVNVIAHPMVRV